MENKMPHACNLSHAECAELWEAQSDTNYVADRILRFLRILRANMNCILHLMCAIVFVVFTACAPKGNDSFEKETGDNLMRYARTLWFARKTTAIVQK